MAAQDNNFAISQPAYNASLTSITLVNEKEKKKQQEELLKLVTALKTVEESLASGKAVATNEGGKIVSLKAPEETSSNANPGGISTDELAQLMADMALALQKLQVLLTKSGQEKATFDAGNSRAESALAKTNLDNAIKQIEAAQNESWWQKLVGWIVAVVSAIAAIVTMNPELLVITALSVLAATGMLSKITQGIADVLVDMGCPKDVANVIAAAIIIVAIIVASVFTGGAAAADAAGVIADATEDGVEMANMAGEAAEDAGAAGENAASNGSSFMEKAEAFFKKYNFFNRLSLRANTMIVGVTQGIASTGFVNNLAQLIMDHENLSKEQQEHIQEILAIVVAIVSIIVSVFSGAAAAGKTSGQVLGGAKFFQFTRNLAAAGGIMGAAGQLAEGGMQITQGVTEAEIAKIKASMELVMVAMNMNNTGMSEDQKNDADIIKEQSVGNRSITKLVAGEQGFTQLLTQYSPV